MASFHRDALTLCAEAFAVVGLADIIFRQAASLIDLASRAASASSTARGLLGGLKGLASAIAAVRSWAENYEASDFALHDGQSVFGSVKTVLYDCRKQLDSIMRNLHRVEPAASGALTRWWTALQFARDEPELRRSITGLSTYTQALQLLVSCRTGNDVAIIRHAQRNQSEASASNHTAVLRRFDDTDKGARAQEDLSREHFTATTAQLDGIQNAQESTSSAILNATRNLDACLQAGFQDLSHKVTTLQVTDLNDDRVLVEGDNLGAAIEPLWYMNRRLSNALRAVDGSHGTLILPRDTVDQVTGEVQKLLKYSARCVAAGQRGFSVQGLDYTLQGRMYTVTTQARSYTEDSDGFMSIEAAEGQDVLGQRVRRFRFACLSVKPSGHGSAFVALVSQGGRVHERIHRQIRIFNVRPRSSNVFSYTQGNDVEGLKMLFQAGDASVLDFDEEGFSVLSHAAQVCAEGSIKFLLEAGADSSMLNLNDSHPVIKEDFMFFLAVGSIPKNIDEVFTQQQNLQQLRRTLDISSAPYVRAAGLTSRHMFFLLVLSLHGGKSSGRSSVYYEQLFDMMWDQGLGRTDIIRIFESELSHWSIHLNMVTAWIRMGALRRNQDVTDAWGRTSLHLCLLDKTDEVCGLLRSVGQSELHDPIDWRRICWAGFCGFVYDAPERKTDEPQRLTFLTRLVRRLLDTGVNPCLRDNQGKSTWDLAQEPGNGYFRDLIEPYALRFL